MNYKKVVSIVGVLVAFGLAFNFSAPVARADIFAEIQRQIQLIQEQIARLQWQLGAAAHLPIVAQAPALFVTASLTASPTSGTAQQVFTFTASRIGGTATGPVTFTNPRCDVGGTLVPGSYTGTADNTFQCTFLIPGTNEASMTVSQGGVSMTPLTRVTVTAPTPTPPPNQPPVVNAGPATRLVVGTSYTHSGAWAFDADNNLASYTWSWGGPCPIGATGGCPALSGNVSGTLTGGRPSIWVPRGPTFTPREAGTHTLRLTVRDTAGASRDATVVFPVAPAVTPPPVEPPPGPPTPPNRPPGADAGPVETRITVGSSYTHLGAWAVDADNNLSRYEWSWVSCPVAPAGCPTLSGNVSGSLTGGHNVVNIPNGPTFTPRNVGQHMLRLTVTDTAGASNTDTVWFTAVTAPPTPPPPVTIPTLTASLTASPTSGTTATTFNFTAVRTEGTATGPATFSNVSCGTGGTLVPGSWTGSTDHTFSCTYTTPGLRTAVIQISQGGIFVMPTASIAVTATGAMCRTNLDCAGMICPMVVGRDTPQCTADGRCICGPRDGGFGW